MAAAGHYNLSNIYKVFFCLVLAEFFFSCNPSNNETKIEPQQQESSSAVLVPMINYSLVAKYPHDITSFTEGFLFFHDNLLESTGAPDYLNKTKSAVGIADLKTGEFKKKIELDKKIYFGEGIIVMNDLLYQLTYTNQVVFVYDAKTFSRKAQFNYSNKEGWGMTTDGSSIIMSDGTEALSYINPSDFKTIKTLHVTENGFALDHLNELEMINGFIYANVWMTQFIVKIDPNTGKVVGKLDLKDLYDDAKKENINLLEMNGIAYHAKDDKIFITGKMWPFIYEIKFEH